VISSSDLRRGADELVRVCLGVTSRDRVLVLTDAHTRPLAERIRAAAAELAPTTVVELPSLDAAYDAAFAQIVAAVESTRPTVTVFAARDGEDRLAWDDRFWSLIARFGARHAQMPALDETALGIGMAADYGEVARFTDGVRDALTGAHEVTVRNALGCDIRFVCDPARQWTAFTGIYHAPGDGGRLPQGEVFCSPLTADGVIAASVIGYPFNASTGLLTEPVLLDIRDGRLTALRHPDPALADRLRAWFRRDAGAARIGELAVGTNRACRELSGNLLFDENVPGCHIALGHPFGDYTGADWTSAVHVDLVVDRPTIHVDGRALIVDGRYPGDPSEPPDRPDPESA